MGGKSGGGMPQQQTPPSPGVGSPSSGVGKSGGGKMGGGTPQGQAPQLYQQRQAMQQRGRPDQSFTPYGPMAKLNQAAPGSNDPTIASNPAMSAATLPTPAAGTPPANQYQQNEQQRLDQQRMQQNRDALRQGGIGGLANYAGRGIGKNGGGKMGGGQSQFQNANRSYSDPARSQAGMQQAQQGLASLMGFAEGGPVTQAPIAWTPTGANISPGTPSGPVVWNPNMFGGAPATGGTGVMTGLTRLGPIVNTPAPTVGVVKYVAPPPVVKPPDKKKDEPRKIERRWAEGWGGEGGFNGGGRGEHAGFSGTQGAHGFSGRGGGGPGNVGGGLYSLGGIVR